LDAESDTHPPKEVHVSIPFSADEILGIAEQIERNGAKFYRKAAEAISDSRVGKRLLGLAEMEDAHEKVFADMRADLSGKEQEPTAADAWGDSALYLQGIADGSVFDVKQDLSEWLTGKETKEDILRAAIGHEKDSIVFYTGVKEAVPEELGKDRIEAIIKEEMSHLALLSSELTPSKR
jgi:rubrerythrin